MSSGQKSKGAFTKYSLSAVAIILLALVQEFASLTLGNKGGAFSHVVWWAAGDLYSWRWALVLAPIVGLLTWCVPHFLFQWGTGVHLLAIIAVWLVALGGAALVH